MDFVFALWLLGVFGGVVLCMGIIMAFICAIDKAIGAYQEKKARQRRIERYKAMAREYRRTGRKTW